MGKKFLRIGLVVFLFGLVYLVAPIVHAAPNAPPVNDNFANTIEIYGTYGDLMGTTVAATKEPGEPNHAGRAGGTSIWYKWIAPNDDAMRFSTYWSDFDTLLAVYAGKSVDALTEIVSNDDCTNSSTSCLVLHANASVTYWIAIDANDKVGSTAWLAWAVPPANDDFANARVISGISGLVDTNDIDASKEPGEPNHAGEIGGNSVWFKWTAPSNARTRFAIIIDTTSTFMLFAIYTGNSVGALTKVVSATECSASSAGTRCPSFDAVAGTDYYIAVDARGEYGGFFTFVWGPTPSNDNFQNAEQISGSSGSVSGDSTNATTEPGEPSNPPTYPHYSIWYQWTAPADGPIGFDSQGSPDTIYFTVFTGNRLEELERVRQSSECVNVTPCVRFYATAGTVYSIAMDGIENWNLHLHWAPFNPPPNDNLANAQLLNQGAGRVDGTNVDATHEFGEIAHAGGTGNTSVWYRWTAPKDGRARFGYTATFHGVIGVYTGAEITNVSSIASSDTSPVVFDVTAGTTYDVAVDGSSIQDFGTFALAWNCSVTNKPQLNAPINGASVNKLRVKLKWQATACVGRYEITIRQGSKGGPVVRSNKNLDWSRTSFRTGQFVKGQTYFWRVTACSLFQCKRSEWWEFTAD